MHFQFPRTHSLVHRYAAVLGIMLILISSVMAFCPDLHEAVCHHHDNAPLHDSTSEASADGCFITQFGQGHVLALLIPVSIPFPKTTCVAPLASRGELVVAGVRYQFPPGRGPPLGLSSHW